MKFSFFNQLTFLSGCLVVFLLMSPRFSKAQTPCVFQEENGLLIIEAENQSIINGWKLDSEVKGFSGSGYIFGDGDDHFNEPGHGLIKTRIKINNPAVPIAFNGEVEWKNEQTLPSLTIRGLGFLMLRFLCAERRKESIPKRIRKSTRT